MYRQQAIIWSNDYIFQRSIYASFGLNELFFVDNGYETSLTNIIPKGSVISLDIYNSVNKILLLNVGLLNLGILPWWPLLRLLSCFPVFNSRYSFEDLVAINFFCGGFILKWVADPWLHNTVPALVARFIGPTWDPPGSCQPQVGPMWASWTLLSGRMFTSGQQAPLLQTSVIHSAELHCSF